MDREKEEDDDDTKNNVVIQSRKSKEQEMLAAEVRAVSSFLKVVNNDIRGNGCDNPMSERTALKFLISRKFDIQRAVQLYQMHEITRLREHLNSIDPNEPNLRAELESGKFTILKHRDDNNSAIAVFTARLHAPNKSSSSSSSSKNQSLRRTTHQTTLQGIVYQLDAASENIITQRNGIVFIYNMSDSDYSNFDYELCQKILYLLKGAYPAKLKKVLIVSPPLWFRAPFHLLRLIVREKLRDRVWLLSTSQLTEHVPRDALTSDLGGTYLHDHRAWLEECNNLHKTSYNDLCDPTSAQTLVDALKNKSGINFRRLSNDLLSSIEGHNFGSSTATTHHNNNESSSRLVGGKKKMKTQAHDYDDPPGMSLSQLVQFVRSSGVKGLTEEYLSMETAVTSGTFLVSSSAVNMMKNRYINVRCYDHSRVVLEPHDLPGGTTPDDPMDYINASYVDGYRQPKAYISTQGPIDRTIVDFWRMIWQTGSRVIVMVTLNFENEMLKCDKYWPAPGDQAMVVGIYKVNYVNIEIHDDFIVTQLKLTNTRSETSDAILKYRDSVLKKQLDAIEITGGSLYPPLVVHCSAGIGRSGTFVTIDICIQKLETTGLVDVKSVVEKLRQQRYKSIQTKDQYIFCYKSVVDYAASCGLLEGEDIQNLFETNNN